MSTNSNEKVQIDPGKLSGLRGKDWLTYIAMLANLQGEKFIQFVLHSQEARLYLGANVVPLFATKLDSNLKESPVFGEPLSERTFYELMDSIMPLSEHPNRDYKSGSFKTDITRKALGNFGFEITLSTQYPGFTHVSMRSTLTQDEVDQLDEALQNPTTEELLEHPAAQRILNDPAFGSD
ncbi:hypothetical protein [Idiomarina abyssalis]|uniref:Uncharacterized protein n=1 Tax=Idiomarina abyssalis TaxID=86102 RepID=A0A8I1GEA1_9GAMM|nr:hypothetical protein [Idiomarina abyssalis]MBJ7265470.1 hypothetical protein [Idiomarina abyssalis]MBJ7316856.1 hypothetical protein [Idiomarina abyssalis]